MPLIPPTLEASMRRQWQAVLAIVLLALFFAVHLVLFGGAAQNYQRAIRKATDMGLAVDPSRPLVVTPPRVLVLLAANMLPAGTTDFNRDAGTLASSMLEELTQLTQRHRMRVVITEPGLTSQDSRSIQLRAHLRVQCTYGDFVALLDDLAREPSLISVDRFSMTQGKDGRQLLDLWLTRFVLKAAQ